MSQISAFTGSVHLAVDGIVTMQGLAVQNFSNGGKPWGFVFLIDGVVCLDTGSRGAPQDLVPIYASLACTGAPRDVSAEVRWSGDPSITLQICNAVLLGFPNTTT